MTADERHVVAEVARRRDDLVGLAADLIAFDTTAGAIGDLPREEAALQGLIAERLRQARADVDLWEPSPDVVAGSRQVPAGLGRPQLAARFAGTGGGRSLLLNGHVDVVASEPHER